MDDLDFESEKEGFLVKYKTCLICICVGVLLVLCLGLGFVYGKVKICENSGGILAMVPNKGEVCVQNFIDAYNCRDPLEPRDLALVAKFCRDGSGLYPLSSLNESLFALSFEE